RGARRVIRSDGSLVRDYFYGEDGAAGYMLLAERLAEDRRLIGEAFNFSNEAHIPVLALVQRLLDLTGSTLQPDVRNEAVNEIRHPYLSANKARALLRWPPPFDLTRGWRRAIDCDQDFFRSASRVHDPTSAACMTVPPAFLT